MKFKFIPTLILFSLSFSQSNDSENDIIEYGFNYTGGFKDGKRHGTVDIFTQMAIPMMAIG